MPEVTPKIKSRLYKVVSEKANHNPQLINDVVNKLCLATKIQRRKITRIMNNTHANWDVSELSLMADHLEVAFEELIDKKSVIR